MAATPQLYEHEMICFTGKTRLSHKKLEAIARAARHATIDHVGGRDTVVVIPGGLRSSKDTPRLREARARHCRIMTEEDFVRACRGADESEPEVAPAPLALWVPASGTYSCAI